MHSAALTVVSPTHDVRAGRVIQPEDVADLMRYDSRSRGVAVVARKTEAVEFIQVDTSTSHNERAMPPLIHEGLTPASAISPIELAVFAPNNCVTHA
jgi:hypothetical protein